MLGTYFYPEYFSKIENSKVREPLMRVAEEINQDLEGFERVLKEHGCEVIRATQPTGYFDQNDPYVPPLQVRNTHAVIGHHMYHLSQDWSIPIDPILRQYCSDVTSLRDVNDEFWLKNMELAKSNYNPVTDTWYSKSKYQELAGASWPSYEDYVCGQQLGSAEVLAEMNDFANTLQYETKELSPLQGPNVINTDHTIYVDNIEYCDYSRWLGQYLNDPRPIRQFTSKAAHVDGCFAVLGHNTILGIDPLIDYHTIFPGYTIVRVPPESYQHQIHAFKTMKEKVNGAWWVEGEEENDEFIDYVEHYLKSWIGYVAESVFDVNVLPLDENTICVSNILPEIEQNLQKQGIECIVVPWRHKFFVDGGLHCITLDLFRDR